MSRRLGLAAALALTLAAALAPAAHAATPTARCATERMADGTISPVLCKGRPNAAAFAVLKENTPTVMEIGPKGSWALMTAAICEDLASASFPMIVDGYTYQYARYHWAGKRPTPSGVSARLVAGTLCG